VALVSTVTSVDLRLAAVRAGVDEFVAKPLMSSAVRALLNAAVEFKQQPGAELPGVALRTARRCNSGSAAERVQRSLTTVFERTSSASSSACPSSGSSGEMPRKLGERRRDVTERTSRSYRPGAMPAP